MIGSPNYEDSKRIRFDEFDQQSKAFGLLIHGRHGFSGIDKTTIRLGCKSCEMLEENGVRFIYE